MSTLLKQSVPLDQVIMHPFVLENKFSPCFSACIEDIVVVVDRSGSIMKQQTSNGELKDNIDRWHKVADFVRNLINNMEFTIAPTGTHLALVSYANE